LTAANKHWFGVSLENAGKQAPEQFQNHKAGYEKRQSVEQTE